VAVTATKASTDEARNLRNHQPRRMSRASFNVTLYTTGLSDGVQSFSNIALEQFSYIRTFEYKLVSDYRKPHDNL